MVVTQGRHRERNTRTRIRRGPRRNSRKVAYHSRFRKWRSQWLHDEFPTWLTPEAQIRLKLRTLGEAATFRAATAGRLPLRSPPPRPDLDPQALGVTSSGNISCAASPIRQCLLRHGCEWTSRARIWVAGCLVHERGHGREPQQRQGAHRPRSPKGDQQDVQRRQGCSARAKPLACMKFRGAIAWRTRSRSKRPTPLEPSGSSAAAAPVTAEKPTVAGPGLLAP